eukprot:5583303-Prorocentrum_lima.AAC.1
MSHDHVINEEQPWVIAEPVILPVCWKTAVVFKGRRRTQRMPYPQESQPLQHENPKKYLPSPRMLARKLSSIP